VDTTQLSAVNLAYFPMTATVASAIFIAISIAMADRELPLSLGGRTLLLVAIFAGACPVFALGLTFAPFIYPVSDTFSWAPLRAIVGLLLGGSLMGIPLAFSLPRRSQKKE
jgi:hypothetical protein